MFLWFFGLQYVIINITLDIGRIPVIRDGGEDA